MKRISLLIFLFFLSICLARAQYDSPKAARDYLLNGVQKIPKTGVPGPMLLKGEQAFPVMVGSVGGDIQAPFVAASHLGKGSVLAFGHGGYLDIRNVEDFDLATLLTNGIKWVSGYTKPRILLKQNSGLASFYAEQGFTVSDIGSQQINAARLADYDVIVVDADRLSADEIIVTQSFIKNGGGLMIGGLGWGWMQLNRGKSLQRDMPGNILLAEAGISWIDGYMEGPHLETQSNISEFFNSDKAIRYVQSTELTTENRLRYGQAFSVAMQTIPLSGPAPFAIDSEFPGRVSSSAARGALTISIDATIPRWHSTGLYAAPGEEITVNLPERFTSKGYKVRIGAHADRLFHLEEWKRHPQVSLVFDLEDSENKVFNPFGGAVFIEVPERQAAELIDVGISGAIQAPHFVLGETNRRDWIEEIRNYPAPWAELEGKDMIISIESSKIRNLDNPDDVLRFWDQAQENNRKLANWIPGDNRPMRIAFDVQISAGYMHSGYPIMSMITDYAEQESMLDMQGDHWGFYHELGHNHQHPDWTFAGSGEVTCNLFTLYNMEYLQGKERLIGDNQRAQKQRIQDYINQGSPFEEWKGEAFLALHMYNQLIEVYGWQALENIIANYTQLSADQRPVTDQDKMDLWMIMYSQDVGENLSEFFEVWGMPITQQAKDKVSHLPMASIDKLLDKMKIQNIVLPSGVLARFRYDDGQFIRREKGNTYEWVEQDIDGNDNSFFAQFNEDDDYYYMSKLGTNMQLRVPKKRGWTQFRYEGNEQWNSLYLTSPF